MNPPLLHSELQRLLDYNPETGVFIWKTQRCGIKCGRVAGSVSKANSYRRIKINGTLHMAHRLAWFYIHGKWPVAEIDHEDRDRANNRKTNLREATHGENQRNKPLYRNSTTKCKGVHWHKQHRKYAASIQVGKRRIHLGLFRNINAAAQAYQAACKKLHGSFARAA